ncbi:MAG: TIGR02266 family protein [Myxococcota bacterium]
MANESDTVSLRITLRYRDLDEFVRRYADNVSAAGLFLRTKAPKPTGTRIRFDLLLVGGTPALRGEGVVVAIRNDDKPGMSLRFNALDDGSQSLVDRIVRERGNGRLAPTPLGDGLSGTSAADRAKAGRTWRSTRAAPTGWTSVRGPSRRSQESTTATESAPSASPQSPSETAVGSRWSAADRPWAQAGASLTDTPTPIRSEPDNAVASANPTTRTTASSNAFAATRTVAERSASAGSAASTTATEPLGFTPHDFTPSERTSADDSGADTPSASMTASVSESTATRVQSSSAVSSRSKVASQIEAVPPAEAKGAQATSSATETAPAAETSAVAPEVETSSPTTETSTIAPEAETLASTVAAETATTTDASTIARNRRSIGGRRRLRCHCARQGFRFRRNR